MILKLLKINFICYRIKGTVNLNPKVRPNNYFINIIGGLIFYEVFIWNQIKSSQNNKDCDNKIDTICLKNAQ